MKRVVWMFAWFAVASPAFGQEPPKRAPELRGMYEDIEVMRAILLRRLTPNCTQCHQGPVAGSSMMAGGMGGMSPMGGGGGPSMGGMSIGSDSGFAFGDFDRDGDLDLFVANHPHAGIARPGVEGVYLKGQGVVFQATLPSVPSADLMVSGTGQAPKSLSDWEKTRLRIRGEKPASSAPAKLATLADILLKSLAENGKNFAQLSDNESLTIIITFRGVHGMPKASEAGMAGSGMGMPSMPGGSGGASMGPPGGMTGTGGGGPLGPMGSAGGGGPPPMGGAGDELAGGGPISPDRELELLGDLHQKRGNWTDAASAYERAIKAAGGAARVRELAKKLAEVYLKTGDLEKARKALDVTSGKAPRVKVQGEIKEVAAKPAIKLPTRLIISAPKKLLDQVGSGKITPADFQKQATFEVLNFDETSATKK